MSPRQIVSATIRIATAAGVAFAMITGGASQAAPTGVTVDGVIVEPAAPAPAALCRLKVRLKNSGTSTVSYLAFSVKIDGQEVSVYKAHTFAVNIDAGTTGTIDLYNFWSPAAAKPFDVQVALTEAQWVQVKKEGTTTTTTPSGPVSGLPSSATLAVKMSPKR